ncbi:uncharacterized protein LOC107657336 [Sinocyclocheilus anshuiensis]|uniref:uncharacterized protein LOC107657336 n=1 Tax=Sinocyclocheilus anshuiensis TaxID=1608454 RepID=UPI0007BA9D0A|nr:PREDICTED: uncharacterized protein LOC107657336 [Sinocyclocheilus anshuiensis]
MEDELQELRDLVAQLRADNARLQQAQAPVGLPGPDAALPCTSIVPPVTPQPSGAVAPERFVFVPRDRRLVIGCGVLVVRDPPDGVSLEVPGVLGMNILGRCYQGLFGQHGSAFFDLPVITQLPGVSSALQCCRQVNAMKLSDHGCVRVRGRRVCRIPGGTMKLVATTCSAQYFGSTVLFEPPESGLPAGLLASPALVRVNRGTVYMPVVNVGTVEVMLRPTTVVGNLREVYIVSLPAGVREEKPVVATVQSHSVVGGSTLSQQIESLDLSVLSRSEQGQVRALLQKYQTVFSGHESDLGCTRLISHDIPLLDNVPVRQRYRRIPPSEYEVVKTHINQLLEAGIVRESCSPYASPIVLVKKKDGSLRMYVDYRHLNAKTRRDAFPLPRIEESLDSLAGARWFSTLDLASGYLQVPVSEQGKPKTAFCTPFGLFEWNRMPFGLCNAPGTFQRLMERLFGDQRCQSLILYLDDVVVFSSSIVQHLERLDMVLGRLEKEGLKAKLGKCVFFRPEVKYLGHVISAQGVATDPGKIEAFAQWRCPETVSELRAFLGFVSYYRRFVEGFAKLAAPLHRLVAEVMGGKSSKSGKGRGQSLTHAWTEQCQTTFEALRGKLTSAPVLAYADFSKTFILEVDASHGGLGAVLSQEFEGKIRPIAYASRSLRPTERNMTNYSSMKLEFLALKWAMVEKFREYLLGHKCIVFTDNNPLSHLATAKLGATEQRWAAELAAFDFEVRYRSGRSNGNADALSRQNPVFQGEVKELAASVAIPESLQQAIGTGCGVQADVRAVSALPGYSASNMRSMQEADPVIGPVIQFWEQGQRPGSEERKQLNKPVLTLLQQWDRLKAREGVLHRKIFRPDGGEECYQLVLPSTISTDSSFLLVKKKDGSLRMCVDYRHLNAKTRRDAFPLPRIEESLDSLAGARWFSTLDLASGYLQVPVSEQVQHLERLDMVLGRLEKEGLKAKLGKCVFFRPEVKYLGHVISAQGVATDPGKIEAFAQWRCPETVSELRAFLGFVSYYRRFVEGFAKLAAPLHRLVAEVMGGKSSKSGKGRGQSLTHAWTEQCQTTFEALRGKLTSAPVLAYADFSKTFILEVDASHGGLGAVLSQEFEGKIRPIAYASRSLRPTERNMTNYSSMKLEFLALKWAMVEKFREYLLGHKCIVFTDNNPLSHLATAKLGATEQHQGHNFESALILQLCELYQVRKSRTTPYHPAGNGQCERFNRTLHNLLRTLPGSRKRDWVSCLSQVIFCYNTTPHQVTGESPYYLMFGQEPQLPIDFLLGRVPEPATGSIHSWVVEHRRRLQVAFEGARERLKAAAARRKRQHDQYVRDLPLSEGQLVYLRDHVVQGRHKIQDLWSSVIYQVVHSPEEGGVMYTIAPITDLGKVRRVHRSLLKACVQKEVLPVDQSAGVVENQEDPQEYEEADDVDLVVLVPETPWAIQGM